MTNFIGKTISHYRIIEQVGQGGMGVVYKALDAKLDRQVAIKFISKNISADSEERKRFKLEAKAAAALNHPNICTIHEINETKEGQYFIVMEFIEGQNLQDKIRSGQLKKNDIVEIIVQLVIGLKEAHDHGIIHRDIKSANIMVTSQGLVKIMDFGLAKLFGQSKITKTGSTFGTVAYMSPEQAIGKKVDHRTDIWSLGIVLYEMITGSLPFTGEHEQAVIYSILNEELQTIDGLTDIPLKLKTVVQKCLNKEKEGRYYSADGVIAELNGSSKQDFKIPYSGFKRKLGLKKNRFATFGLSTLLILIFILAIIFFWPKDEIVFVENRILIGMFENQTQDAPLEDFDLTVSQWLTNGLRQTELVEVIFWKDHIDSNADLIPELNFSIANKIQSRLIIFGNIYDQAGEIQIAIRVWDMKNDALRHSFDIIKGNMYNIEKMKKTIQQKVMGYLAAVYDERLNEKVGIENMSPTYDAYKEYVLGYEYDKEFNFQAEFHFLKAYELDTTFFSALVNASSIMAYHRTQPAYVRADSLCDFLRSRLKTLLPVDRAFLDFIQSFLDGNIYKKLINIRKAHEIDKSKAFMHGTIALRCNYLNEALDIFKSMDETSRYVDDYYPYWYQLAWTYHFLGDFNQELQIINYMKQHFNEMFEHLYFIEIRALSALGKIEEVEKIILENYQLSKISSINEAEIRCDAAREFMEHGFKKEAKIMLRKAIQWYESQPGDFSIGLAMVYYQDEQWDKAQELFESIEKKEPHNIRCQRYLGLLAARRGDQEKALKISEWLETKEPKYCPGDYIYWRACIAALLGNKGRAVELLNKSFDRGLTFTGLSFFPKMDFEGLKDYGPYQMLMKPKEE